MIVNVISDVSHKDERKYRYKRNHQSGVSKTSQTDAAELRLHHGFWPPGRGMQQLTLDSVASDKWVCLLVAHALHQNRYDSVEAEMTLLLKYTAFLLLIIFSGSLHSWSNGPP
jgi:hypothetical protein